MTTGSNKFNLAILMELLKDNARLIKVFISNSKINQKCYLIAIRLSI